MRIGRTLNSRKANSDHEKCSRVCVAEIHQTARQQRHSGRGWKAEAKVVLGRRARGAPVVVLEEGRLAAAGRVALQDASRADGDTSPSARLRRRRSLLCDMGSTQTGGNTSFVQMRSIHVKKNEC